MKKFIAGITLVLITLLAVMPASAQILQPVHWTQSIHMTGSDRGEVVLKATIDGGWHMYSHDCDPAAGPSPLSVTFPVLKGVRLEGGLKSDKASIRKYDDMFGTDVNYWEGGVTLRQAFVATESSFTIDGVLKYAACNDQNCIPPAKEPFTLKGTARITAAAKADKETEKEVNTETVASDVAVADTAAMAASGASASESVAEANPSVGEADLWAPVSSATEEKNEDSGSLWYIFFTCFLGGFVALLTPCVWPMIPMTVSFFLKKGKSNAKGIGDAITYGISIIVIYVLLGLLITVAFGPSALNALSTSAICNIIFFLLLVVFAISFFGAFEIKLPSSWTNKMDNAAGTTTGLISIFFMAFTLVLVSFSCTGPIIGTLLVEAVSSGSTIGPAVGMFGFSLALAIPFCLFAIFPGWLQKTPKSGSWMNTIKVVLGFVELALSLKFLSVADLAYGWHILDRETFLVLWIVIFALLGLYLLGRYQFSHYGKADSSIGVFRFFLAMISLSFAIYLVPGLWGAPLKSVSAFVPPLFTQDFNLYARDFVEYDDFEKGMAEGVKEGKPVLIDFSGFGCVNCRKMEGAVLDNDAVHDMIQNDFVLVKLMVDDKTPLPQPITVEEYGKKVLLETYGDKWSYLQRHKFNANAQPYYVILNEKGELLSGPVSYDENVAKFVKFLTDGLEAYK